MEPSSVERDTLLFEIDFFEARIGLCSEMIARYKVYLAEVRGELDSVDSRLIEPKQGRIN